MSYWQQKLKCLKCGLHFVACSDYEYWPNVGTTRDLNLKEATGVIYCPECGSNNPMLHWREEVEGFIGDTVPGKSELITFRE